MKTLSNFYKNNYMSLYLLIALTAVECLMSFSFLGYVHIEPISVTIAYVPVLLAGALGGLAEATILGAVFGFCSMWKASANYVMPMDQLFSPFLSGSPAASVALSIGSRVLFGIVVGLLYLGVKKTRFNGVGIFIVTFLGKFIHSLLVYTFMGMFFPETGYSAASALHNLGGVGEIVSNLIIAAVVLAFWKIERSRAWRQFCYRVEKTRRLQLGGSYHGLTLAAITVLTLGLTTAVAAYFVHRMDYVLSVSGIVLTEANYSDLVHLQIQFLIGVLSLITLLTIFVIFHYQHTTYMNYEAKTDALTGVMSRRAFFGACGKMVGSLRPDEVNSGWFIMIDMDYFKEINDRYGHPEGDRALKKMSAVLKTIFGRDGVIGRIGGDEFAVLLYVPTTRERLETDLNLFLSKIHKVEIRGNRLSCSIGAVPIKAGKTADELYKEADEILYTAKQKGRDTYVIAEN